MNKIPFGKIPQKAMHKWSAEVKALNHFLFSKKLDQALKRTYDIIAKSFAALPSYVSWSILFFPNGFLCTNLF